MSSPAAQPSHDAVTAARVGGAMQLAGGLLGAVLAVLVPESMNGHVILTIAVASIAMLVGALCLGFPRRVPNRVLPYLAPMGTLLIGFTSFVSSTPTDGSELLYVWPVLYSSYYMSMRAAFANVVLIALVYVPIAISVVGTAGIASSTYVLGTSIVTVLIVVSLRRQLDSVLAASERDARTDSLTGATNRRGWDERLGEEIARSARTGAVMSMLMIDLDHFKRLNDSYGHAAGDVALAGVASVLRASTRRSDVVARFGGEEFAMLLPECAAAEAQHRAEDLRRKIEAVSAQWPTPVTVSVGVASLPDHAATADGLLAAADAALYEAKGRGRNRVRIHQGGPTPAMHPAGMDHVRT